METYNPYQDIFDRFERKKEREVPVKDRIADAMIAGLTDSMNPESYDEEFYKTMLEVMPLDIGEVDARVRRAIVKFVSVATIETTKVSSAVVGFLHGYQVAMKLKRDIEQKGSEDVEVRYLTK